VVLVFDYVYDLVLVLLASLCLVFLTRSPIKMEMIESYCTGLRPRATEGHDSGAEREGETIARTTAHRPGADRLRKQ
jgi:hypothetical protein